MEILHAGPSPGQGTSFAPQTVSSKRLDEIDWLQCSDIVPEGRAASVVPGTVRGAHRSRVRLAQYYWIILELKRPWLVTEISAFPANWVSAIPLCWPWWTGKICICVCQWDSTPSNILMLYYVYVVNVLYIYSVYTLCIYSICWLRYYDILTKFLQYSMHMLSICFVRDMQQPHN